MRSRILAVAFSLAVALVGSNVASAQCGCAQTVATSPCGGCGTSAAVSTDGCGCGPQVTYVEKTTYVNQWSTVTKVRNVTKYKNETKTRMVTVNKCVPEVQTKTHLFQRQVRLFCSALIGGLVQF